MDISHCKPLRPLHAVDQLALPSVIPPFRFGVVQSGIYRGAYPKPHNFHFLKRLGLKTIITLAPIIREEFQAFCNSSLPELQHFHFIVEKAKENVPITMAQILIDRQNEPIYLHCLDGANVTGMVLLCLRKLQLWSTSAAFSEFNRYVRDGSMIAEETEFFEAYSSINAAISVNVTPVVANNGNALATGVPSSQDSASITYTLSHIHTHTNQTELELPLDLQSWLWPPSLIQASLTPDLAAVKLETPTSLQIPSFFIRSVSPHPSTLLPSQPFTLVYAHPSIRVRLKDEQVLQLVQYVVQRHPNTRFQSRVQTFLPISIGGATQQGPSHYPRKEAEAQLETAGANDTSAEDFLDEEDLSMTVKALALESYRRNYF